MAMQIAHRNLVIGSLSLLVAFFSKKFEVVDRAKAFQADPSGLDLPLIKEFDFIVVGSGSAGGVVANQLSKEFTVLLLESGGDPIPQTYLPSNFAHLQEINTESIFYNWKSVQQQHANQDSDGVSILKQGRILGGTSVINGMVYNRGHPKDYNNWANLTGDDSWSYASVLKYFKMSEDFYEEEDSRDHLGVGGPLSIRKVGKEFQLTNNAFLNAGKELGYEEFTNSNAPQKEGFGLISQTIQFGRRFSVYDAFIKPILNRVTLTVSRYSPVSKVDIDDNNRAVGVYYTCHGVSMYAKANLEVILSAGTLNSPMILLSSGVGPAEQLNSLNIPVKSDLQAVGRNLQDHPCSTLCAKFENASKYPVEISQMDVNKFLAKGRGFLTYPWGLTSQAFIVSQVAKSEGQNDWPDLELLLLHNSTLHSPNGDNSVCINVLVTRGSSRGSISLDSKNVLIPGIWDPNWLAEDKDVKIIAEGFQIASRILESKSFLEIGVRFQRISHSACKHISYGTLEYWQCYARRVCKACRHIVGTCKMGNQSDPTAVVDTKLRVKGVLGLRVIDNSIQPVVTNANTNAPAIMIGQKGAAIILEDVRRAEQNIM